MRNPIYLGTAASVVLALASYGGGATRNRGGILDALGLSFLSFGHGAGFSNVTFWCSIMLVVLAWVMLGRQQHLTRTALMWWIPPLVFAGPILSRDVYSYLMQGAMMRDGFDPYTQGAAVNPGPYLLEVSHDWRNTTTPYGPLHLWLGEGITRLVGENVTAGVFMYKLVSLAGFAMIVWAVPRIAKSLGGDPDLALWLGVANPVMTLHLIGGMHNESIMVGLVSVGLVCALHKRFALGVILVSLSVSLKATAVFALPFMVWLATRSLQRPGHTRPRRMVNFLVSGAWMATLSVAVVALVTYASGSSWGWVSQISGNSKVINPLALPSLLAGLVSPAASLVNEDFSYNAFLSVARSVSQILMLVGLVTVWWLFRRTDRDAIMGTTAAYAVAVVFNAVTLPWYYTSLISLLGTFSPDKRIVRWATGLSVFIAVSFTGSGNHQLYNVVWMALAGTAAWYSVRWIELGTLRRVPPQDDNAQETQASPEAPNAATAPSLARDA
ncbi:alpha-(1-_6)-mannopyranosyltransferase A [Corynebacterium sp.]|uniref:alpha-(1->6)-mannopyranosyltransferase A n=1 Tax=Corynebacterium sp. TaxID=1720 RepID=UPI0026DB0EE1|nr:alpha-(1->6)-mannopyranosyltransferase A [Corynebacterium sp.]MDO5075945.1 alpha-(1->6)-mannopyranosyltransferase A [Corynebacterium sp.]